MTTSGERRFSITREQGEVIKISLLLSYGILSALKNSGICDTMEVRAWLDKIYKVYEPLSKYDWRKKEDG